MKYLKKRFQGPIVVTFRRLHPDETKFWFWRELFNDTIIGQLVKKLFHSFDKIGPKTSKVRP